MTGEREGATRMVYVLLFINAAHMSDSFEVGQKYLDTLRPAAHAKRSHTLPYYLK